MTDRYEPAKQALKHKIAELRELRDAQVPESGNYWRFQRQINDRTAALLGFEDNAGLLAAADAAITQATRRVHLTRNAVHTAGRAWTVAAGAAGVVGGVLLLSSLMFNTPTWVPVTSVVLFVAVVAGLMLGLRARREAMLDWAHARKRLAEARQKREELLPEWSA